LAPTVFNANFYLVSKIKTTVSLDDIFKHRENITIFPIKLEFYFSFVLLKIFSTHYLDSLFPHLRGSTDPVTQVIQLGSAHIAASTNGNLGNDGRVDRESTLNADAKTNFAYGKGFPNTATFAASNNPFKSLCALAGSFNYSHLDGYGVARSKLRYVISETGTVNDIGGLHRKTPKVVKWTL
jgi:hypothetical protein